MGVSDQPLRQWHGKFAAKPVECGEQATLDELRELNKRLRRELRRAELEREIPPKGDGVFREGVAVKHAWIREQRTEFPVVLCCDKLDVSTWGYYTRLDRPMSRRAQRSESIRQAVQQVHAESHGIYGIARIAEALEQRADLEGACRNTVARAMHD